MNKEKRVQWALKHCDNDFEDVVWTDKSTIQLENYRMFSFRKVGTAPKPIPRAKHPYKVMVWAGISRKGATNVCLLNCSVNSAVYQEVLHSSLAFPSKTATKGKAPARQRSLPHLKSNSKFLKTKKVPLLKTSPESSDLNPIENVWHEMKHYFWTTAKPKTKEELLQAIEVFWATVTPEKCSRYTSHLRKVIPKVITLNGEPTGY